MNEDMALRGARTGIGEERERSTPVYPSGLQQAHRGPLSPRQPGSPTDRPRQASRPAGRPSRQARAPDRPAQQASQQVLVRGGDRPHRLASAPPAPGPRQASSPADLDDPFDDPIGNFTPSIGRSVRDRFIEHLTASQRVSAIDPPPLSGLAAGCRQISLPASDLQT